MNLVTAGTIVGEWERTYVLDATNDLSNPTRFNYYIKTFEEEFAKYVGAKYALAVATGTAALHLALLSLGIKKGDEVILPNLGFVSAAYAVSYTGAKPVFVDVDPDTWTINPLCVRTAITENTKAILPVYMYGRKPEMSKLKQFGIPTVEDACPAIGTKGAGTYGIGCFSFQGAKTLAIGEGGMLTTNSKRIYDRAKKLGNLGKVTGDFYYDEIGFNYRMSNIQAALGLGQLKHIDELIEKKRQINEWYGEYSSQKFDKDSVCWMNSYIVDKRKKLRAYLTSKGIDTRVVFPTMTSFPMYKERHPTIFADAVSGFGLNLPSATYLTKKEVEYVKSCIETYNAS